MIALAPTERQKLMADGLILPGDPAPIRERVRNHRLKGKLSVKECAARHICTRCRVATAIHYSEFAGYGVWCPACIEWRKGLRGRPVGS